MKEMKTLEVNGIVYDSFRDQVARDNVPRIGENGNWWVGDTDTGVSAGGSGGGAVVSAEEKWELLEDITIEEDVQVIGPSLWEIPQKKIRVVLDTLAASADTTYMSISVPTSDVVWSRVLRFYAVAMPRKSPERSFYEIECVGDGHAIVGIYHDDNPDDSYDNNKVTRMSGVTGGRMILTPIDSYGFTLTDQITGFGINTYGIFEAGTRLRIWGVAK